jgi:hypothetical protein
MPARKATASGKWSQSIWDVTPGVGDDVFANNFTVEIDQNVNVGSLRTAVSGSYAVAGGGFTLFQPLSVIASPGGFLAGSTTCLTSFVSAGTATLSGSVTGGSTTTDIYGINVTDGSVNLFGNTLGGGNTRAYGIYFNSTKNLTVVGDVSGSRNGSVATSHGIINQNVGNCYVTGNIVGGNNATGFGISNFSVGLVSVLGSIRGDVGSGITQNSTGTVLVTGTITSSVSAHGVVSASTAARNEFTGTLVNSISGRQAVYCAKYLVHPKMFDSATVQAVDRTGTYVTYFAPEAYSSTYVPHTSSVALGTAYAAVSSLSGVVVDIPVQLSGIMVVPSAGSVSLGTLVGQTSGTAILNSEDLQNVWNTNINTLTTDGTIFKRLANSATVSDVGTVLQTINL